MKSDRNEENKPNSTTHIQSSLSQSDLNNFSRTIDKLCDRDASKEDKVDSLTKDLVSLSIKEGVNPAEKKLLDQVIRSNAQELVDNEKHPELYFLNKLNQRNQTLEYKESERKEFEIALGSIVKSEHIASPILENLTQLLIENMKFTIDSVNFLSTANLEEGIKRTSEWNAKFEAKLKDLGFSLTDPVYLKMAEKILELPFAQKVAKAATDKVMGVTLESIMKDEPNLGAMLEKMQKDLNEPDSSDSDSDYSPNVLDSPSPRSPSRRR